MAFAPARIHPAPLVMLVTIMCLGAAGPASAAARTDAAGTDSQPTVADDTSPVTGTATFYANAFHGKVMADGTRFDMNDPTITAANAWPLGTRLLVRRLPAGPWHTTLGAAEQARYFNSAIVVTVRDRGRFTHALDLSRGAFARLGNVAEGVITVQITPLSVPAPKPASNASAGNRDSQPRPPAGAGAGSGPALSRGAPVKPADRPLPVAAPPARQNGAAIAALKAGPPAPRPAAQSQPTPQRRR
jgi:rare lipoprotein A (peptidoglycan hydrolase)